MEKKFSETLSHIIENNKKTEFGYKHNFENILRSANIVDAFQKHVPLQDYNWR